MCRFVRLQQAVVSFTIEHTALSRFLSQLEASLCSMSVGSWCSPRSGVNTNSCRPPPCAGDLFKPPSQTLKDVVLDKRLDVSHLVLRLCFQPSRSSEAHLRPTFIIEVWCTPNLDQVRHTWRHLAQSIQQRLGESGRKAAMPVCSQFQVVCTTVYVCCCAWCSTCQPWL